MCAHTHHFRPTFERSVIRTCGRLNSVDPQAEVKRLAKGLARLLEEHRTSARAVSLALRPNPAYLNRALRGERPLRVVTVLQSLVHLGERPYEFFELMYPFGGQALPRLLGPNPLDLPGLPTLEEVFHGQMALRMHHEPAAQAQNFALWMKRALSRAELPQKECSERLGWGPNALPLVLRGASKLNFEHVFGVLGELKRSPGRMFYEVFLPPPSTPMMALRREQQLDLAEEILKETELGFRERFKKQYEEMRLRELFGGRGGEPEPKG